jgi:hypothetical protein
MAIDYKRVYTIEINGRPVAVFESRGMTEARSISKEAWLREELAALKSGGMALLAAGAKLGVRAGTPRESEVFGRSGRSSEPADDEVLLIYLVPIDG